MSEVKVNKLSPRSGTTVTLGDSGDTFTVPSGVTFDASSGGLAGTLTTAAQPNITSVGTLTALNVAGNATITTTDNSDTLKLVSTDADATRGPVLVLHRDSGSPADNDVIGELQFAADSDAASETNFALLIGTALDVSHGTESGELDIQTRLAGTGRSRIKMNSTETIINDDSVNLDFRVESDANANMFFVNAGNDRIGIGTSGPSADLDVVSSADATNFRIENTTHNTIMDIVATTANKNSLIRFSDSGGSPGVLDYDHNNNSLAFTTNGSEAMRINSSGDVGIGTSSPSALLDLAGQFSDTVNTNLSIEMGNRWGFRVATSANDEDLHLDRNLSGTPAVCMTWDKNNGNVGIGTTSPPYKFSVDAGSDSGMGRFTSSLDGGDTNLYVGNSFSSSGSTDEKARVTFLIGNGSSAIGGYKVSDTETGANRDAGVEIFTQENNSTQVRFRIDHQGNITASDTSIGSLSDERLKKDITDFTYNLDTFKSLKPRTFNWKNAWLHGNETNRRGFIAQELETVDSYWVSKQKVSKKPDDILEEATYYEVGDEIPEGKKVGDIKTEATYSYKYEKGDGSDNDLLNDGTDLDNIEMIAKLGKKDAMYVSVIQQLISKIETLEAEVTALKNQP